VAGVARERPGGKQISEKREPTCWGKGGGKKSKWSRKGPQLAVSLKESQKDSLVKCWKKECGCAQGAIVAGGTK